MLKLKNNQLIIKLIFIVIAIAIAAIAMGYDMLTTPTINETSPIIHLRNTPTAPNFTLTDISGKKISLTDIKAEKIILNFWASWCSTCVIELPDMLELTSEFNGEVALVTISIDDTKPVVDKFLSKLKMKYPKLATSSHVYWLWDEHKNVSLKQFNITRVPETILINHNRNMVNKIVGEYNWAGGEIRNTLKHM